MAKETVPSTSNGPLAAVVSVSNKTTGWWARAGVVPKSSAAITPTIKLRIKVFIVVLGLEVPTTPRQLFLALCWSLIGDQQSSNDHGKNTNDNKLFHAVSPALPMSQVRRQPIPNQRLQLQIVITGDVMLQSSLLAQMALQCD